MKQGTKRETLVGRRCYDHMGGRLGAALLALYLKNGWLEEYPEGKATIYRMTAAGRSAFAQMGLPAEADPQKDGL